MIFLELCVGLALLLGGGDALVRGSVAIAARMGVSRLLIGLTLVGFGTSMPELVASLQAAWAGAPGLAVGNIVGSNIANILLILGISALLSPIIIPQRAFRRDGSVLMAASLIMVAIALGGEMTRLVGALLFALVIVFTIWTYRSEKGQAQEDLSDASPKRPLAWWYALTAVGIGAVVGGADILVDSAIDLARMAGITEAVIGLTLVAVGTSLPELATSVMAALRRQNDVAFGNVVGSNIFNILGIGGATALIIPIPVPEQIMQFDIWVMLASALLLVVFAISGGRLSRKEGYLLLMAYVAYLAVRFFA